MPAAVAGIVTLSSRVWPPRRTQSSTTTAVAILVRLATWSLSVAFRAARTCPVLSSTTMNALALLVPATASAGSAARTTFAAGIRRVSTATATQAAIRRPETWKIRTPLF